MKHVLAPFLAAAALLGAAAAEPQVRVAFSSGDYVNYQNWNWDSITHLGFWTAPNDDVRAHAAAHGVRLYQDSHLPDSKTWHSESDRKQWVAEKVDQVKSNKLDGVFFDYEGQLNNKDLKDDYTKLAQETSEALAPLNASIFICVGGRPSYEFRNFDYSGLANASEFLFIMAYDMHFWDDYTCVLKGTCSPAEAPIDDVTLGVKEYTQTVSASKLVLGLPWYGQRYTSIVGFPINEGQIKYADTLDVISDKHKIKNKPKIDSKSQSWVVTCNGACVDGKKGNQIWYDDATTLTKKYAVAQKYGLRGVGCWEVDNLPTDSKYDSEVKAMWAAWAAAP